jgi:hypothetical protein
MDLVAGGDALVLSWPEWADDWELWSTTNIKPPVVWSLVTNPAVNSNGYLLLSVAPSAVSQFYRLVSP